MASCAPVRRWKLSDERREILSTMSVKEQKRRRYV